MLLHVRIVNPTLTAEIMKIHPFHCTHFHSSYFTSIALRTTEIIALTAPAGVPKRKKMYGKAGVSNCLKKKQQFIRPHLIGDNKQEKSD